MGEYDANGNKLGTCEMMYYLRLSDAPMVRVAPHSLDPWKDRNVLWFRLPMAEATRDEPVEYAAPVTLPDEPEIGHGTLSARTASGIQINFPCSLETRHPGLGAAQLAPGIHAFRNGGTGGYDLRMMGVRDGRRAILVRCRDCGRGWSIVDGPDGEFAAVLATLPADLLKRMGAEWTAEAAFAGRSGQAAPARLA